MSNESTSDTSANFVGNVPGFYDRCLVPNIFEDYAAEMANRVADLSPHRVLELAAGTGVVTQQLASKLSEACTIVATDLNEPMLDLARSRIEGAENVHFETADAMALPFEESSQEVVACQFGVMFFPDKTASFREVHRVLSPGGHYVFNAWNSHAENTFARLADETAAKLVPDNPPPFYKVPFHYHDPDLIRSEVEAAGFEEVTIERRDLEKTVSSLDALAEGLVYGNPVAEELLQRGRDPSEMKDHLREGMKTAFGENPSVMPLSAWFVTARK